MLMDDSQIGSDMRVWIDEDDRADFDQSSVKNSQVIDLESGNVGLR